MYSLCLRSPQRHLVTGRAVLLFVGLGLFYFQPLSLVLAINKCGLGTNASRWGWQHGSVHKKTAGLELLPKFRLFLRKGKHFTILLQPRLKYLWQHIKLLEFMPRLTSLKGKLIVDLEAGVTVWQWKLSQGRPGLTTVREGKCRTAQPQPPPAPFSSPSKELDTSKDLLALRPWLFSHLLK